MRTLRLIGIFLLIGIVFSCSVNSESTQKQEAEQLNQLFSEIKSMAFEVDCEESSEWTFSSFGSKSCGGPVGYLAYSAKIDTALFLKKIEEHKIAQEKFNDKWGIISDCSIPPEPTGVLCKNGEASFIYSKSTPKKSEADTNLPSKKIQLNPIPENTTK